MYDIKIMIINQLMLIFSIYLLVNHYFGIILIYKG